MKPTEPRPKVLPLVLGTVSFWLGKKADEYHSHRWTTYVRHPEGKSLSQVVDHVIFQLHPSFPDPTRKVSQEPYEVSETGWGEFEIVATVHFAERLKLDPVSVPYPLKLYPEGSDGSQQNTKRPVVKERYEEIVVMSADDGSWKSDWEDVAEDAAPCSVREHLGTYVEEEEIRKMQEARLKVEYYAREIRKQLDGKEVAQKR